MTTFNISLTDTANAVAELRGFIPNQQLATMGELCRAEEGDFFRGKFIEYAKRVTDMPKTHEQDGKGDDAVAFLHYFAGACDWFITEKDMGDGGNEPPEQHQAYGYADLGWGGELGYISLVELCALGQVQLDLHWTPKTLAAIKVKHPTQ